jgi:Phospholipase_D-nuclease N-terminal
MDPVCTVMLADIGGLLLLPIGLSALAFWVWMVVDCARHETGSTMVAWLLAILFAGVIAAPLYFFLRRLPRQRSAGFHLTSPLYQPWQKDQTIG